MSDIDQKVSGNWNSQNINYIESKQTIDLLPEELDDFLTYLSNAAESNEKLPLSKPDLSQKNILNGVDESYFQIIEKDFIYFQDIDDILRNNNSNELINKYKSASSLLNLEYHANYKENMILFMRDVLVKHKQTTNCNSELSLKLLKLLHYMYAQCDIGVKP